MVEHPALNRKVGGSRPPGPIMEPLGGVERVALKTAGGEIREFLAKVDTGSDGTSLDESVAKDLGLGPGAVTSKVKSSHGVSVRPVIHCTFTLAGVQINADVNITDRSKLKFPMLIGKDVLNRYGFIVDTNKELLLHVGRSELTAAVVSLGSESSLRTIDEMGKLFKHVDNIDMKKIELRLDPKKHEILYGGKPLGSYDCVYVKGSFRYAQVSETIARFIFSKCYTPIHPSSFEVVHDKLSTHLVLHENNIPMPATYFAASRSAARDLLKGVKYPIIMKFPKGTQGKGVLFADSYTSANTILDALDTLKQPFIVQEYIDTNGEDIRAIVLGNHVVAAMKRKAASDDIRSNIHMGGLGEKVTLDEKTSAICVKTAKVLMADICAVDLLMGPHGALVIEANISPGLQGITKATGINVAQEIAKFLYDKAVEFRKRSMSDDTQKLFEETGLGKSTITLTTEIGVRGNSILIPDAAIKKTGFVDGDMVELSVSDSELKLKRKNDNKTGGL